MNHSQILGAIAGALCLSSVAAADLITLSGMATITSTPGSGVTSTFGAELDSATVGQTFSFSFTFDSETVGGGPGGNFRDYLGAIVDVSYDFGSGDILGSATPIPGNAQAISSIATGEADLGTVDFVNGSGRAENSDGSTLIGRFDIYFDQETFPGSATSAIPDTIGALFDSIDVSNALRVNGGISVFDANSSVGNWAYSIDTLSISGVGGPVVPLPSASGLGLVGLAGVASRRRR